MVKTNILHSSGGQRGTRRCWGATIPNCNSERVAQIANILHKQKRRDPRQLSSWHGEETGSGTGKDIPSSHLTLISCSDSSLRRDRSNAAASVFTFAHHSTRKASTRAYISTDPSRDLDTCPCPVSMLLSLTQHRVPWAARQALLQTVHSFSLNPFSKFSNWRGCCKGI